MLKNILGDFDLENNWLIIIAIIALIFLLGDDINLPGFGGGCGCGDGGFLGGLFEGNGIIIILLLVLLFLDF